MIDIGVIPKLILLLNEHKRLVVRRTVVGVFVNITYRGSMEQIKHLVDQGGCIPPLLDLLLEEDTNVIINVLKTLFNVSCEALGCSHDTFLLYLLTFFYNHRFYTITRVN